MPRIPGIRRLFRAPELASVEREVDDELRFHFEERTRELVAAGLSPEAARAEAERSFGDVAGWRERLRRIDSDMRDAGRRAEWWGNAGRDLRLALRGLRRQPGFARGPSTRATATVCSPPPPVETTGSVSPGARAALAIVRQSVVSRALCTTPTSRSKAKSAARRGSAARSPRPQASSAAPARRDSA